MKYAELVEKARETYESEDTPHVVKAWLLANIIYPADESEDERTRKELIEQVAFIPPNQDELNSELDTLPCYNERIERYRSWLEKQGEQKANPCEDCINDKGCVTCEQGELRETHTRTLNADEVIAWLVANIVDFEYYVKWFKKDFKL